MKKPWKDSYEYKRILEILDTYWLCEAEEFRVRVQMDFVKANGEVQGKCIIWQNPNYGCEADDVLMEPLQAADMLKSNLPYDRFWNTGEIYKREDPDE